MKYWRINTDSNPQDKVRTCDVWYQHGMAFAGDHMGNRGNHATVFGKLSMGDGVFMHHSGAGIVGFGYVKEDWDGRTYEGDARLLYDRGRGELYEYRIRIDWDADCDCRHYPLSSQDRLPYMGTYCEVNPGKWDVEAVVSELRRRAKRV